MSDVYSVWQGPSYQPLTANDMMADALNQPMAGLDTLADQFVGGILASPILGTDIRTFSLPDGVPRRTINSIVQGETTEQFQKRYEESKPLDQTAWKQSQYFRKGIEWDDRMNEDRAAALAEWYDAKKVREYFGSKRPYTSFVGNLAGFATDPINYIPVAGPLVKGAAVARLGRVGGEMAAASADAISNTALGQAAAYQGRRTLGDEITWQSTLSELAMAGLVGAAFGGIGGTIKFYKERGETIKLAERQRQISSDLSTVQNVQDARIALNDAIGSVAKGEDLNLNPTSIDAIKAISDRMSPISKQDLFSSTTAARGRGDSIPIASDFETLVRNKVLSDDPVLSQAYKDAEAKVMEASATLDVIKGSVESRKLSDTLALIDPESAAIVANIEKELAGTVPAKRRQALEAQRDQISETIGPDLIAKTESDFQIGPQKKIKAAQAAAAKARNELSKVNAKVVATAQKTVAENRPLLSSKLDTTVAPAEAKPRELAEAATRVGKPDDAKALATQHAVNPEDGSFVEQTDIEQVRQEGRLTEEDEAELKRADQTFENSEAYGEALKAAISCLL